MNLERASLYVSTISTVVLAVCFFLLFDAMEAELAEDVIENERLILIEQKLDKCAGE